MGPVLVLNSIVTPAVKGFVGSCYSVNFSHDKFHQSRRPLARNEPDNRQGDTPHMIIRRYILREVTLNFFGVALLLSVMFLSSTFVRLLTETLEGDYPAKILFTLFALKGVGNLVFIFPLAFFLGTMLALGRLYKDSEMVVLTACGVRPVQILKSVAIPAVVIALLVGYLALFFAPWAEDKSSQIMDEAGARTEIEGIVPGRFNQFDDTGPVVYVEGYDQKNKELTGVFVQFKDKGRALQLTAEKAYEQTDKRSGARYIVLLDGYRYEGRPGQRDYRIIKFREHGIRIQERAVIASSRPRYAINTGTLLKSGEPGDMAELQWRLAMPISTILLGLLAVPLSKTSPRRGRFGGLFLGIMIYVVYNNLLTMMRSSLGGGEVPAIVGLWWVHALLLMLLVLIYWSQNRVRGPRNRAGAVA
jgi:lipopolysaccharide export system permease protein